MTVAQSISVLESATNKYFKSVLLFLELLIHTMHTFTNYADTLSPTTFIVLSQLELPIYRHTFTHCVKFVLFQLELPIHVHTLC